MTRAPFVLIWAALVLSCKGTEECVDDRAFFREKVWPEVIQPTCMACHTSEGAARASGMVFASTARPDHLDVDLALFSDLAGLERDGTSILLLKPLGKESHGGGEVLTKDAEAFTLIEEFVARQDEPVSCPDAKADDLALGLEMMPPAATLRKASLLLVGRLPRSEEIDAVRAGGEAALVEALQRLMDEPGFTDRMKERFNDLLLTDRYLLNRDGLGLIDEGRFPQARWFESSYDEDYDQAYDRSSEAIAREPLELIGWVIHNHLPFTEILTADYTMVNGYSAMTYGVEGATPPSPDDPVSLAFYPSKVPGWPHAGLLSTPAFVNRYPTTDTNRNRHRAWKFYNTFLATDILSFAQRPIDPTISSVHNPTLNDPQCAVCHATLDPVAGTFQDFDAQGFYNPPEQGWYADMRPPGFGEVAMPSTQAAQGLTWLAQQAARDRRFALATVRNTLTLTANADLLPPDAGLDPTQRDALAWQDAWIDAVATELVEHDHDLRHVVQRVVLSPWFRATADRGADPALAARAGLARLLTPEELDRKIEATLGIPWTDHGERRLRGDYAPLYGGIDSFSVTARLRAPNGVISAIGLRMATEMACAAVPADLILPQGQRRLFPYLPPGWVPQVASDFTIPAVQDAIRANLVWLHHRLLGDDLSPDDPEIEASWALLRDAWAEGSRAVEDDEADASLPWSCQIHEDPVTGAELPEGARVEQDSEYLIRAWMAVIAWMLTDHHFLYE